MIDFVFNFRLTRGVGPGVVPTDLGFLSGRGGVLPVSSASTTGPPQTVPLQSLTHPPGSEFHHHHHPQFPSADYRFNAAAASYMEHLHSLTNQCSPSLRGKFLSLSLCIKTKIKYIKYANEIVGIG